MFLLHKVMRKGMDVFDKLFNLESISKRNGFNVLL